MKLVNWPTKSLDLNYTENLWGILARYVYKNAAQFANKDELISSIKWAWENISKQT